jgi:hypothetical protein
MTEALIQKLLATPPHEEIDAFREMSDEERDYVRPLVLDLQEATDLQRQELEEVRILKRFALLMLWGEDPDRTRDWVIINPALVLQTSITHFFYWLRRRTRGIEQRVFEAKLDDMSWSVGQYRLQQQCQYNQPCWQPVASLPCPTSAWLVGTMILALPLALGSAST